MAAPTVLMPALAVLDQAVANGGSRHLHDMPLSAVGGLMQRQFTDLCDMVCAMVDGAGFDQMLPSLLWCGKRMRDVEMPPSPLRSALRLLRSDDLRAVQQALSWICTHGTQQTREEALLIAKNSALARLART